MRIISTFHDYYDTAMGVGIDKNLIYHRKTSVLSDDNCFKERDDIPKNKVLEISSKLLKILYRIPRTIDLKTEIGTGKYRHIDIYPRMVGFCGKVFPCFSMNSGASNVHYDMNIVDKISNQSLLYDRIKREDLRDAIFGEKTKWKANLNVKEWIQIQNYFSIQNVDALFIELGVPVFTIWLPYHSARFEFELNPELKRIGFQAVKDPFTCFQDISMYLGNQLVQQVDPRQTISDTDLRDEKGFDKWSFRKHRDDPKPERKNT